MHGAQHRACIPYILQIQNYISSFGKLKGRVLDLNTLPGPIKNAANHGENSKGEIFIVKRGDAEPEQYLTLLTSDGVCASLINWYFTSTPEKVSRISSNL